MYSRSTKSTSERVKSIMPLAHGYQFALWPLLFRFLTDQPGCRGSISPSSPPRLTSSRPSSLRRQRLNTNPVWPHRPAYHNPPGEGIPFTGGNDRPDVPKLTSAGRPGIIGQWSPRSSLTASPSMMSC